MINDPARNARALDRMIEALATRRTFAVTGAGLSWWAGYHTWPDLIRRLAVAVREQRGLEVDVDRIVATNRNPLHCAQKLGWEMGQRAAFETFIRNEFAPATPRDSRVLAAFARIPFRHVLTLNFEESHERTYAALGTRVRSISSADAHDLREFLRALDDPGLDQHVVHVHGKVSDARGSITLTEEDYAELYRENRLFRKLLWLFSASRTLVFCGFGFNDSDFLGCFRETARDMRGCGNCHYAIVGLGPDDDDQERRNHFNDSFLIEPVFYEVGTNGDGHDHDGFASLLHEIVDRVGLPAGIDVPPAPPLPQPLIHEDLEVIERLGRQFVDRVDPGGADVPG